MQEPQLPQGVNYDINAKSNSEVIVKNDQIPLQESFQAGTIEKELPMTSNSETLNNDASANIQKEVDLMNFDDDCLNFDFNNNHVNKETAVQHVTMIDQLLCDHNFGSYPLTTKDESKGKKTNNVQENKVTQNEQITSKPPEQEKETPKEEIPVKDNDLSSGPSANGSTAITRASTTNETQKAGPYRVKPTQTAGPYRIKPVNGTETAGPYRVKPVNGMQSTVAAMEMTGKPIRKKIYSFMELLIYQFSPITKELNNDIIGRLSHDAVDYDLLTQVPKDQPRYPGVLRGRWGWDNRVVTSPIKHFENPLELSFLKECVVAQNRWTALLFERELRISCENNKRGKRVSFDEKNEVRIFKS